jgi:hypothetical protein
MDARVKQSYRMQSAQYHLENYLMFTSIRGIKKLEIWAIRADVELCRVN